MNRFLRVACGVALAAALAGCKDEAPAPAPEAPKQTAPASRVVPFGGTPTMQRRFFGVRSEKMGEVRKPEAPAKVQVKGTVVTSGVEATQVLVWLGREECGKAPDDAAPLGRASVPAADPAKFFIDVSVPQNSTAWICAAALDARLEIVAEGAYEKNPVLLSGSGQIIYDQLKIALRPRKTPAPIAKGLLP